MFAKVRKKINKVSKGAGIVTFQLVFVGLIYCAAIRYNFKN